MYLEVWGWGLKNSRKNCFTWSVLMEDWSVELFELSGAFLMCSACCDISSSQLLLHPVGKDVTEECEDAWSISKAKESHQVLGAHLLWLVVPYVTGRKSCEQHTSPPAQHKPFAELLWRQSWAVLQGLLSTQKSNDQYGQVSISMRHAHKKKKKKHYIHKDFHSFTSWRIFPGFLLNSGGLNIYIYFYIWIYIFHIHNLTSS